MTTAAVLRWWELLPAAIPRLSAVGMGPQHCRDGRVAGGHAPGTWAGCGSRAPRRRAGATFPSWRPISSAAR